MPGYLRRLLVAGLAIAIMAVAMPALGAGEDVGRQAASLTRITTDGYFKEGAVISADGSTVAYSIEVEPSVYAFMVVPTDGSAAPRELFRTSNTKDLLGLRGPNYKESFLNYYVFARDRHLALSPDGSQLVLQMMESNGVEYWYHFGVVNTRTRAMRLIPEAAPTGMGTAASRYHPYGLRSDGEGYWDLADGGKTIVWVGQGVARNGSSYALVAQDVATGQARRVAGYSSYGTDRVGDADPPGWYGRLSASSSDSKVIFLVGPGDVPWVADVSPNAAPPTKLAAISRLHPRITGQAEYTVTWEQGITRATFRPLRGGNPIDINHRDVFTFPFADGRPGLVEHPVWTSNTQEIRVVRPDAAAVMLKPGENGLPAGWKFGVESISNSYHWTLVDASGSKVVVSMMSPDGKSNDLWVLTLQAPAPAQPATPDAGTGTTTQPGASGATGQGTVNLNWAAAHPAPAGYNIFRSTEGPGHFNRDWPLTDFPVTSTTFTDTGLVPGTTYYYTIVPIYQEPGGQVMGQPIHVTAVANAPASRILLQINSNRALVGDRTVMLDVPPTIINNRTVVPLRFIGENLGAEIGWDGTERKVTYKKAGTVIYLWIDRPEAMVNGQSVQLDVPPTIMNDRTVVPLRFVATALGAKTEWNPVTSEVTITP